MLHFKADRSKRIDIQEYIEQNEQDLNNAIVEKREYDTKRKEYEIQICRYEEYLNSPEMLERAQRLENLREQLADIRKKISDYQILYAQLEGMLQALLESEPKKREHLEELIAEELILRKYFEQELSLGLVLESKDWSVHKDKYLGRPKLPKYKPKNGLDQIYNTH